MANAEHTQDGFLPSLSSGLISSGIGVSNLVVLSSNGKSLIASGTMNGREVVVKTVTSLEPEHQRTFKHELDVYVAFSTDHPSFGIALPLAVSIPHCLVVLDKIDGHPLSKNRYPKDSAAFDCIGQLLQTLDLVREYRGLPAVSLETVQNEYRARWKRYIDRGIFTSQDIVSLERVLTSSGWQPEFNHGDPIPPNIQLGKGRIHLFDWEFAKYYVPFYDFAVAWVISIHCPDVQQRIERRFASEGEVEKKCFALNLLNVTSRELRIHEELPSGHELRERIPLLRVALQGARRRLDQIAS